MIRQVLKSVDKRVLAMVLTVPEVALLWGKQRKSVEMAIYKNQVVSRRTLTDSAYLLMFNDIYQRWGEPTNKEALQTLMESIK